MEAAPHENKIFLSEAKNRNVTNVPFNLWDVTWKFYENIAYYSMVWCFCKAVPSMTKNRIEKNFLDYILMVYLISSVVEHVLLRAYLNLFRKWELNFLSAVLLILHGLELENSLCIHQWRQEWINVSLAYCHQCLSSKVGRMRGFQKVCYVKTYTLVSSIGWDCRGQTKLALLAGRVFCAEREIFRWLFLCSNTDSMI